MAVLTVRLRKLIMAEQGQFEAGVFGLTAEG